MKALLVYTSYQNLLTFNFFFFVSVASSYYQCLRSIFWCLFFFPAVLKEIIPCTYFNKFNLIFLYQLFGYG